MSERARRAFEADDAFERREERYVLTNATFDAAVEPGEESHRVIVTVPMLDAVVVGETVAPVVEDGWYETFERRLEDVGGVTRRATVTPPTVTRDGDVATVETSVSDAGPEYVAETRAVVNYVEGTWFEGAIPGYEYDAVVQSVRERAHQQR